MNLFDLLNYDFMQRALLTGSLIALICAVLSCFLILRGWSLMGDAISHAVLPGIVLAYVVGIPLIIGAFLAGLLCAVSTGFIKENSRVKEDTVMGVVFTGMFALGLVMFSKVTSDLHLDHILYGNILGITAEQARQTMIVASVVLVLMLAKRRDFLLLCFDPSHTRVLALRATLLHYALLVLLSLTIVVSLQAVGIILVTAMLITPGAIGFLWAKRFDRMLLIAVGSAVVSNVAGILISYYIDGSTGACIVILLTILFVISLVAAPRWHARSAKA